jgi:glycosyltransferase involved in cell wall biosynthesis
VRSERSEPIGRQLDDRLPDNLTISGARLLTPRLSVLMPTYNYARYLPEAIESVLQQDFQDFEMIIVDDCSWDESEEVIRRYAARDSRIRFRINRPNRGMVANWNYCLSLARGEYVQFLFGDDKLANSRTLTRMVQLLDENPSAVVAAAARNIIDDNSSVLEINSHLGASGLHRGLDLIVRCLEQNANIIGEPSVVMMRRREAARGFDPRFRQIPDLEMWFHLLEKGDAVYTAEPLYSFRRHSLQQTAANRVTRVGERESLILLAEYYARPSIRNLRRRKFLFTQVYTLRKVGGFGPETRELEQRMYQSLGAGWYFWFWLLRKLGRPFANLKHSFRKRFLRPAIQ